MFYFYFLQVTWSDTDKNDHTNYASYIQFAINGIQQALKLKEVADIYAVSEKSDQRKTCTSTRQAKLCLRGMSREIMRNGLHSAKISFLKESLLGDVLDIHLWQEDGCEPNVFCVVELGGKELCQIQLEYFNPLSHL